EKPIVESDAELVPSRWGTRPLAEITSLAMLRHGESSGSLWTSESHPTWLSGFIANDSKSTSLAWSPANSEATALRSELARLFNLPASESASSTSADWPAESHSLPETDVVETDALEAEVLE